mmetsp:Transcript_17161/g.26881  ORF Transcript_17161/g.26881 Transcript_17161/m.26881 type:complete len:958 (-) Transcript_17161:146-3019(-)
MSTSSKSIEADVGILGKNNDATLHDTEKSDIDIEDKDDGPMIASRLDVYNALKNAKFIGSSSFGGKADGTMTIPALPPMSGLFVHDIGRISLPIAPSQANTLKAHSWKTNDDVFTNIYQVEAHSIDIQNPFWDASLSKLVKTVAFKFGIRPDNLSAKLDMLLHMEKGSSIDWCSNVEEDENIIGSMLIQLPSIFTGGKISVFDGDEDVDEENEADFITSFNMGESNNEAEFACHFVCHYSDCQYEIEEITSGSRVLLRYSLLYNGNDGVVPTADLLHKFVVPLKTSLTYLPRADRMILVPLGHDYSPSSLTLSGIDALAPDHRAKAESIRLAGGNNWTVLILNVFNTFTTRSERDVNGQSKFQTAALYDSQGKKVDHTWMKKILSFNPLEGEVANNRERMLLSTSARLVDNWGKRKSRKTKTLHHGGYDSDSPYGYGYDYHTSYEYTSTYKATFLLAYDMDSVFELKCVEASKGTLSGRILRNDGVIAAVEEVVKKQDYSMLGRLLEVVEFKEELRFDTSTCRKLLEMMVNSLDNECDITSLASRILGALSTSAEPDSLLWNTIVSAVRKFKWCELRKNVSSLLCDESRKKGDSRRSRISLTVFLNRIDFCIKLTATKAKDESNFALKCISHSIDDLAGTDLRGISYGMENLPEMKKLDSMVVEHGWKAMAEVVKHSLEFYSSNAPERVQYFIGMGRHISKFHGNHSCNITLDAMTTFAATFSSKMQKFPDHNLRESLVSSSLAESLIISIQVVIDHGEQNDMDLVGKKITSQRNIFSSFLKRASELSHNSTEPQTFLLDLLNKLFMQQSIEINAEASCVCPPSMRSSCECRWNVVSPDNSTEDNTKVSPSLHVNLTLGANPHLASLKDKDGRFPLHYAATRGVYETVACVFEENPKAAIVCDPLTGLYPFMLAGSNGNAAAAFELLLSDPNLVLGGIPADEDDEEKDRKRKRSPSM